VEAFFIRERGQRKTTSGENVDLSSEINALEIRHKCQIKSEMKQQIIFPSPIFFLQSTSFPSCILQRCSLAILMSAAAKKTANKGKAGNCIVARGAN
jgi:hypothetical protein